MRARHVITLSLCGAALAACATEPAAGPLRVLVKLARPGADPAVIAALASQAAKLPAGYVAASSPLWHALSVECNSQRDCEAALARLRADRASFDAVERDERKRIVTP